MLDELIHSNAVDKRWAEGLIAGAATLEDLERAAIGTADNRWRIARFDGRAVVDEARYMARLWLAAPTCREPRGDDGTPRGVPLPRQSVPRPPPRRTGGGGRKVRIQARPVGFFPSD